MLVSLIALVTGALGDGRLEDVVERLEGILDDQERGSEARDLDRDARTGSRYEFGTPGLTAPSACPLGFVQWNRDLTNEAETRYHSVRNHYMCARYCTGRCVAYEYHARATRRLEKTCKTKTRYRTDRAAIVQNAAWDSCIRVPSTLPLIGSLTGLLLPIKGTLRSGALCPSGYLLWDRAVSPTQCRLMNNDYLSRECPSSGQDVTRIASWSVNQYEACAQECDRRNQGTCRNPPCTISRCDAFAVKWRRSPYELRSCHLIQVC